MALLFSKNTLNQMTHTDFGFQTIKQEEKTSKVQQIFSEVAPKYDLMNDLMSGFQHRLWKQKFVDLIPLKPALTHLDVASGTGDIVKLLIKRLAQQNLSYQITASDLNENMLHQGKDKLFNENIYKNIDWVVANAEALPFPSESFDSYSIVFGIRNVTNRLEALKEAHRCLKPGGLFLCMEFSKPQPSLFSHLYHLYAFQVIPKIGELVTQNKAAYNYLVESIECFLSPDAFCNLLKEAGFKTIATQSLMKGCVTIYTAWKA